MRIKIIAFVLLVLLAILLISCQKEQNRTNETSNITSTIEDKTGTGDTLNFRITWKDYSGRGEAIQKIVDSYNEKYSDGNTVLMTGGDEDLAAIESLFESDPDTVYVLPYRYVKYFGDKGNLADLTMIFGNAEDLFYPEVWELGTVDGVTYGIPWLGHSMCLLYNTSLLEDAGVDAGSINSLELLLAAMEAVEDKTDARGIGLVGADSNDVSWMVNQFIYGFGSSLVNDDGTMVTINNAKTKAALNYYKNVLGGHAQPTWVNDTGVEVMDYFRNQQVAFEIQGIWGVTDILKNGSPFDVGMISMEDIGLCAEVGPMMLAIPENMSDDKKEEAIRFIRYLISKEAQEKIMNGEYSPERDAYYPFRTPIRVDMADSQIFKSNPEYLVFIEGFRNPSIDVPVPAWETVKDGIYEEGLHRVMNGELTIDEFLQMIETQGDRILNEQIE